MRTGLLSSIFLAYPPPPPQGYPPQGYPPPGYPPPGYPPPPGGYPPPSQGKSTAAGVLLIIAAIIAIINFAILIAWGGAVSSITETDVGDILVICGAIGILMSILALIGGIMAVQHKMWGFALVGAIIGLFTLGPVFISSILSLVALILIAVSKEEFES